eukprot:NODE_708_length_4549_cov_0.467191.p2 type:complete len:150 gc:universal NODE_708_length_4549_cov_0.467191:3057-3506(+)
MSTTSNYTQHGSGETHLPKAEGHCLGIGVSEMQENLEIEKTPKAKKIEKINKVENIILKDSKEKQEKRVLNKMDSAGKKIVKHEKNIKNIKNKIEKSPASKVDPPTGEVEGRSSNVAQAMEQLGDPAGSPRLALRPPFEQAIMSDSMDD